MRYFSFTLLTLLVFIRANAQTQNCDLEIVPDSLKVTTTGAVWAMAKSGNTLYMGGNFSAIAKYTGSFSGLDTTGKPIAQPTWPKVIGTVLCTASDGNGGWYIGGKFAQIGDSTRKSLAYITPAGKLSAWNPGTNGTVNAIIVRGNRVYIGGSFSQAGGASRSNIAALSSITGAPLSWNPSANKPVLALEENNGVVYAGGQFSFIGGGSKSNAAMLDTATGSTTSWSVYPNGDVRALKWHNGTLYLGGTFTTCVGTPRKFIAAVDPLSGALRSFNPAADSFVNALDAAGNRVYAAGAFIYIGGNSLSFVAAMDTATGTGDYMDLKFDVPTWALRGEANAVAVSGNRLFVGGIFNADVVYNGPNHPKNNILSADLSTSPAQLRAWNPISTDTVNCLATYGQNVYAGGVFTTIGGFVKRNSLAAIDIATGNVTSWNPAPTAGAYVRALTTRDGIVYAGGSFGYFGPGPYNASNLRLNLAGIDSATGSVTAFNPGISNDVYSLAVDSANLYVGGDFNKGGLVATQTALRLAAFNRATGAQVWQSGANNRVRTVFLSNNVLYAGGDFTIIGGASRATLAAINPATGVATTWNPNPVGSFGLLYINDIVAKGDSVYVCGYFSTIGGVSRRDLAGINRNTGATLAWNPGPNSSADKLAIDSQYLYTSGAFYIISGQTRNNVARYSLPNLQLSSWNMSINSAASAMVAKDGHLFLGGYYFVQSDDKYLNGMSQFRDKITTPQINITSTSLPCVGYPVTFVANANFSGASGYSWQVNGNAAGSSSSYTYTPTSGDKLQVVVNVPTTGCYTAPSGKDTITVTTLPLQTPTISLSAPPSAAPGSPVTVTANVANAGSNYTIDWAINGVYNSTTSGPSLTYTKGTGAETIDATLFAGMPGCYTTTKALATPVDIADPTGIHHVSGAYAITVYPNPFKETINIDGSAAGHTATLYDALGKVAARKELQSGKEQMAIPNLPEGSYYLRITDGKGATIASFSLVRAGASR
jgi:hypothetical protein